MLEITQIKKKLEEQHTHALAGDLPTNISPLIRSQEKQIREQFSSRIAEIRKTGLGAEPSRNAGILTPSHSQPQPHVNHPNPS